jgi:hypothetical protein
MAVAVNDWMAQLRMNLLWALVTAHDFPPVLVRLNLARVL